MLTLKKELEEKLSSILKRWDVDGSKVFVEETSNLSKGDLTTNIAMQISRELSSNPRDIAQDIVSELGDIENVEKIEIAGPGFINFYLSESYLKSVISNILENGNDAFKLDTKAGQNLVIEYTDPNPFKVLHIGHLYTNMVGEAFARLQEALGGNVKRAIYQGDVGLHVAKTMWGLMKIVVWEKEYTFEELKNMPLAKRVNELGRAYGMGNECYEESEDIDATTLIRNLNYYIFSLYIPSLPKKDYFEKLEEIGIKEWYFEGRKWCMDYFEEIYERTDTKFDYYFLESEMSAKGLDIVLDNTDGKGKGIFKSDDGSIIYEGDPQKGLHTRVFVNKDGLPTYEAKELALALAKEEKIEYSESVVITGDEQTSYFKVVFDALSHLNPKLANVSKHYPHGMVKLPGGKKISSRKGEILGGEWLLNETQTQVKEVMNSSEKHSTGNIDDISNTIAVAAIKYAFLKVSVGKDVVFDIEKSISFDGDTGPYLLYVYARCMSLLREGGNEAIERGELETSEEKELVRVLSKFENTLLASAVEYSPSILCEYLFDLGQTFNKFYQNVRILDSERRAELLALVRATAQTMKYGLDRLGIKTVDQM